MAKCNIQTLLNSAACFLALSTGEQEIVELQLLCEILALAEGGIDGGGGYQQVYCSDDTSPIVGGITPDDTAISAIWYQRPSAGTGSNVWLWDTVAGAWSQFSV